jgi:hypothetical protein
MEEKMSDPKTTSTNNSGGNEKIRIDEGQIRKGGVNPPSTTQRPQVTPPPSKPVKK